VQGLFIGGGWAGKSADRFTRTGLPRRADGGAFFFRFPIGDRHIAYEWAMVRSWQKYGPARGREGIARL
jgi:hypothetical protein